MSAKLGRNEPCRCGSGRKFKRCCLPKDEAIRAAFIRRREREARERDAEIKALLAKVPTTLQPATAGA